MHHGDTEKVRKGNGHFVFGTVEYAAIWSIKVGHHIGECCASPVTARVKGFPAGLPCVNGRTHISGERIAHEAFLELVLMLLNRNDKALQRHHFGSDYVVICLHLLLAYLIRIRVEIFKTISAGSECKQTQQKYFFMFHNCHGFLEVELKVYTHTA